jgi:hypothetical protein
MSQLIRTGVSLEEDLLKEFDRLITKRGYENRSEAIRDLIRDALLAEIVDSNKPVVGTLTLVYDHHVPNLSGKLTETQHAAGRARSEDAKCVSLELPADHHLLRRVGRCHVDLTYVCVDDDLLICRSDLLKTQCQVAHIETQLDIGDDRGKPCGLYRTVYMPVIGKSSEKAPSLMVVAVRCNPVWDSASICAPATEKPDGSSTVPEIRPDRP